MGITNELKQTLKRLRLSGMLATLPDRVAYAKGTKLAYTEFLELVLNDEIQRREDGNIERRLKGATVDLDQTFERFDWDAAITVDREKLKELFSLEFVGHNENILICGPVGVGKTFIANALAPQRLQKRIQGRHAQGKHDVQKTPAKQSRQLIWEGAAKTHKPGAAGH